MTDRVIRALTSDDWPDVARIYEEGIQTGNATFETRVPEWEDWDAGHLEVCRLVLEEAGVTLGWAALSAVSRRQVYSGVAEHSIYVAGDARGRGVGAGLLGSLVTSSEEAGFWTLQTAIFPENETSISLHTRYGFRVVGVRERLGLHRGRWRDVVLMERRSPLVGQSEA
jgi:phosphinothricin acetyltransferase